MGSPSKPATAQVLVAVRPLGVGTLIREPEVTLANWAGPIPANAVLTKEDVIGRGVISTIYEGEPIVENRLAPKGAGAGLAATIPPGMRAVAVRVNEIIGVSGFVLPGMRVDVLIAGSPPSAPPTLGTLSKTLLQNIEVLSAGQNIQKDAEGKPISAPVVNLLVTPEQAEVLSLASTETKIQLVLRNPLDTEIAKTTGPAVAHLFSGQKLALPETDGKAPQPKPRRASPPPLMAALNPPKPKPPVVVEVIQGGKKSEYKFQESPEGNQ
jgi:pilus assembly protein CpaB